jgi:hypothetical protein
MATNMPPVHAVDGLYRPIYRRPGGPPADCPWGLIARATSRVVGRAVKVLVRIPRFIRIIIDPVKMGKWRRGLVVQVGRATSPIAPGRVGA